VSLCEFVCLSFGDLERLKQERDKCLKQDETLICQCSNKRQDDNTEEAYDIYNTDGESCID
jgi:hypothetical protein